MDGEFKHTVERFVFAYMAEQTGVKVDKVRLVHRLDYATSGVVLVSVTKVATAIAAAQFEARTVRKVYIALLHGHISESNGVMTWSWPVAGSEGFKMELGSDANPGRSATSLCEVIGYGFYQGAPVTKVRLIPLSGRRHQLRLHAAAALHPIVGDATYSVNEIEKFQGRPGFIPPRMMLHAHRLDIQLPTASAKLFGKKSGMRQIEPMTFIAEDPFLVLDGLVMPSNSVLSDTRKEPQST